MTYMDEERHFRRILSCPEWMVLYVSKIDSDNSYKKRKIVVVIYLYPIQII